MTVSKTIRRMSYVGVIATLQTACPALAEEELAEEIVVTASKTGQNFRQMSGSANAISGSQLEDLGAKGAEDYLATVPGAAFNSQQPGFSTITIRGVSTTTNFANISQATTGSYINDIPLTDPYFTSGTPDIDAFDVANVEVYRGPQGTLFGSASLGGAVNYIANGADVSGFSAAFEGSIASTSRAGNPDVGLRAMLNVPVVEDRIAIRAVGTFRRDAGFIDNVGLGTNNVNDGTVAGGRLLATFKPTDGTTLSWISLYQETDVDDVGYENPDLGRYRKSTAVPEHARSEVEIHSLRLDQDLSFATLTTLGSYHRKKGDFMLDLSRFSAFGFSKAAVQDESASKGFTFELRLSDRDGPFRWLLGGMIDRTKVDFVEHEYADNAAAVADALLGPGGGAAATRGTVWGLTEGEFKGREKAVFGEASYLFAEKLELTVGGRWFQIESDFDSKGFGLLYAAFVNGLINYDPAPVRQSESGFSPKFALSYRFSPDVQVYASTAKGFRFGGPNVNPDPSLVRTYSSDGLWNYEVGLRGRTANRRLTFDASGFIIDWTKIQLPVVTASGTQGIVNAGDARIKGAEISLGYDSGSGLSLQTSLTYLDAKLTRVGATPGLVFSVAPGATLPGASDWRMTNVIRYEFRERGPFVQLSHRFVSEAPALLQAFPLRKPVVGDYHVFDLRAGLNLGDFEVTAFASNLTNRRAVATGTYTGNFGDTQNEFILRPRTIGVTLRWKH